MEIFKKIILSFILSLSLLTQVYAIPRNHYKNKHNYILNTLVFNISYSGDAANLLEQIKAYDPGLHVLRPLGKFRKINVNLSLDEIMMEDLVNAVSTQTSGQVQIIYDGLANTARLNYTDKFDVGNDAVTESLKWQNGDNPKPILKNDGVVRFPYGEYQPIVICQPLNLCDIELQQGEQVEGIVIGDSLRWNEGDSGIPIVYSGSGSDLTPHLVLKASQSGLETTLLVTTSRRTYMIKLKSRNNGYVARSGFYYPDELIEKFQANKDKLKNGEVNKSSMTATNPDIQMPLVNLSKVNYDYTIKGSSDYLWKPTRVFDDGISVYIELPDVVNSRSLPGVCVLADGSHDISKCEMVNFRYNNHFYIIDKLFDEAVLMNGFGDNAEIVKIYRNPKKTGFFSSVF